MLDKVVSCVEDLIAPLEPIFQDMQFIDLIVRHDAQFVRHILSRYILFFEDQIGIVREIKVVYEALGMIVLRDNLPILIESER